MTSPQPPAQAVFAFPGRWLTSASLLLGPVLLLAGVVLRARFPFFFPDQLAAYEGHPALMTASYSCFAAGTVALWPAVSALTARIGTVHPTLAGLGGGLTLLGLFARTFHAGADHMAFRLVDAGGARSATTAVGDSYQSFHIFQYASFAIMLGWIVLAIGTWRSGILGPVRSLALALMALLPLGVLKGTTPLSIVATAGLCIALVPLGLAVLTNGPRPTPRSATQFGLGALAVVTLAFVSSLG
ncbi:hypothetical protein HUT06_42110 [Actinomadura sp. NAK00032]|uniref:hypothetical protein n=1 Tax=Actinomadura sp. NAK00032 TaxID=2742128 RepID=UPI0015915B80|nr:hypothetical protein [Actinomadura sp. NAK00032]QKW39817.1 hypothetical protein HUT06_42110 [Actinomadura sp. NAK00032]